jgi:hypothetical protein
LKFSFHTFFALFHPSLLAMTQIKRGQLGKGFHIRHISYSISESESTLMQGKHLRRSFAGHPKSITAAYSPKGKTGGADRKVKAGGASSGKTSPTSER